jgi:hypothetical protein
MSFGFAIGDFLVVTKLAWDVVQNSRKACGVHDSLTHDVTCLHVVLRRLEVDIQTSTSPIHRMNKNDGRRNELNMIIGGCNRVLKVLDQVLQKYNGLSNETRRTTKLWQRIRFGNGEMKDLDSIKRELTTCTFAITLFLNLLSLGSQGRVEQHMETHSLELRELRHSLNWITASLQAGSNNREESILTSYADDDRKIWKQFRRELLAEGFSSTTLTRNKSLIKDYVLELGERGALDIADTEEDIFTEGPTLDETEIGVLPVNTEPGGFRSGMDDISPTSNPITKSPSHPQPEVYALFVSGNSHSRDGAPSRSRKATEIDAQKYNIPSGYSLEHWNPERTPITLFGNVFDAESVGRWIHQSTIYCLDLQLTDSGAELRQLLADLVAKVAFARGQWLIGNVELGDMLDVTKESERLISQLNSLVKACEQSILREGKARTDGVGLAFVDLFFGCGELLEETEGMMTSIRDWNLQFDAWWEEI